MTLYRVRPMRKTHVRVQVALALMEDPAGRQWGYDLSKRARVRSGSLYPVLHRMLEEGWLSDGWEEAQAPRAKMRPPRRYYTVTAKGAEALGALLAQAEADSRFHELRLGVAW